uniref:Hexosyltransferase n=1 Tax=Opuntia streptacantha TaxID=393608 RepID=A0A7C8YIL9_OPUST
MVFLDDDIVIQTDLSPLWDIDMKGKVNGAVQTCRGKDEYVMSKRFKNYLNFSHPLIADNFDPQECAWAYGMNIFDLEAWRKTNISATYYHWLDQNLKSDLSLWQLGTLPPGLIAFQDHVHVIDPYWHMLGLGYQENTSAFDASNAAVIHFNGRAKPWLDTAFPHLRPLWAKYINFSDKLVKSCHVREI